MAKAAKTKKVKEVVEEIELPVEPIIETPVQEIPEPVVEEVVEVIEVPEPVKVVEEVIPVKEVVIEEELTYEQKIEKFLEGKEGFVKANDFLKSLFGVPKFNEPAKWLLQGNSKLLKSVLDGMVANNDITVRDNMHRLLGQSYYPDTTTGKQEHRNLNNVEIYIKK